MKRYVGVHLSPFALRTAIMKDGKPTVIPACDGGLSYSTQGIFSAMGSHWRCDIDKLAKLLRQVRSDVERFAGVGEWEMVLAVPNSFGTLMEGYGLRPAAMLAKFPICSLMRECTAVALNYFWNGMGRGEDVFRIAVGMATQQTVSASVIEISDGVAEEYATAGETGEITPDKLRAVVEQVVREADEITSGEGHTGVRALLVNNETVRKPAYRDTVIGMKRPGQKTYGYPEETAALGAALQAAKRMGLPQVQEPLMLTVTPFDYDLELAGGRRIRILSRNTTIPTRKSMILQAEADGQTSARAHILSSDGKPGHAETALELEHQNLPALPAAQNRILVTLEVDASGLLSGSVKALGAGEMAGQAIFGALPAVKAEAEPRSSETAESKTAEGKTTEGKIAGGKAATKEATVTLAEFENFRRRMTQEKEAMYDKGICKALTQLLPVVDSFERGLAMLSSEQKTTEAAQGMERIYRQLQKAMEDLGVRPIEAVGQPFDLNRHNAVMQVEIPGVGENIIVEEFEKGYLYHDTVLRYSTVKVNK